MFLSFDCCFNRDVYHGFYGNSFKKRDRLRSVYGQQKLHRKGYICAAEG